MNNKVSNASQATDQTDDTKQQLYDILTSEDYSTSKEVPVVKEPDSSESSWLVDLLDALFGNLFGDWVYVLSALFKGLLLLALLSVIYLIVKNADSIAGWLGSRSWRLGKANIQIDDYRQSHLAQGWESLPPHAQIPEVVKQLLTEGQVLPASSILYRGSLRWLNNSQSISIRPANTEMQCVRLIKKIKKNENIAQNISKYTADYVVNIIQQWMPIAYNGQGVDVASVEHGTQVASLRMIADEWHRQLPLTRQVSASTEGEHTQAEQTVPPVKTG